MGIGKFLTQKPKGQRRREKIRFVGDVDILDMGGGNVQPLDKANNLPFKSETL